VSSLTAALLLPVAFLFGSIPTGLVLTRARTGKDIRELGSGNIGASNVARNAGFKLGALVCLIDILKGVVPVLLGVLLGLDHAGLALVALAAVAGHDFSVFLRFRGGKGVATTLGVAMILAPLATTLAIAFWIVTIAIWRYTSVASLIGLTVLPLGALLTGRPAPFLAALGALAVLGFAKHWENILRLAQGRENKFRMRRLETG
jgi:acyl phosphate:glycerol-3-phosphate acyltransferase